jgi:hypothetical protein
MLDDAPDLLILQKTNHCLVRTMFQEQMDPVCNDMQCMVIHGLNFLFVCFTQDLVGFKGC